MPGHALRPLSDEEICRVGTLARQAILENINTSDVDDSSIQIYFSEISLVEPSDKFAVLLNESETWFSAEEKQTIREATQPLPRVGEAICTVKTTRETAIVRVDLGLHERIISIEVSKGTLQPAISAEEYDIPERILKKYKPFVELCVKEGLDISKVKADPWCPGYFSPADAPTRRLLWPALYYQESADDNMYGRPLSGLKIMIDIQSEEIVQFERIQGYKVLSLPPRDPLMNYYERNSCPRLQAIPPLKRLDIVQPEGASFSVSDQKVEWQGWKFYIGFTSREGLVLHLATFHGRPVMYRASFAEMVVPYGDTDYPNYMKNAFDAGEDGLGRNAHSLKIGCDCKGLIHYFDAALTTDTGGCELIKNAVCMHEEDDGIAWKHKDWRSGRTEVRRSRKLVLSFLCTVANYEYGFFIELRQDGGIQFNVKLTGIVSTSTVPPGQDSKYATTLFRGNRKDDIQLVAPIHQHFFVARLDMAVDGIKNNLYEVNVVSESIGKHNPYNNGFYAQKKHITSEIDAVRDCNTATSRHWIVESTTRKNRTGEYTGYVLHPAASTPPLGNDKAAFFQRAGFLKKQFWATPFNLDERFPGGDFPNQCPRPDGLTEWTKKNRSIEKQDLVLWHVFGTTHVVRLEDWPVMPCANASFKLEPFGFFDCSPVVNLPKECIGASVAARKEVAKA